MTDAGAPRRGRHSSEDTGGVPPFYWVSTAGDGRDRPGRAPSAGRYAVSAEDSSRHDTGGWGSGYAGRHGASADTGSVDAPRYDASGFSRIPGSTVSATAPGGYESSTGGFRRVSGVLDRSVDETGRIAEWDRFRHRPADEPDPGARREPLGDAPGWGSGGRFAGDLPSGHPSAPLPPRPPGVWDRLTPRNSGADDETEAHPLGAAPRPPAAVGGSSDEETAAHPIDWDDSTGGLDVIGAHVDEPAQPRSRWRRSRGRDDARDEAPAAHDEPASDDRAYDEHGDDEHGHDDHGYDDHGYDEHDRDEDDQDEHDDLHDGLLGRHDEQAGDEHIPVRAYDRRQGRARRRRPVALMVSLLLLGGLVAGIVIGGEKLLAVINPAAQDYSGQGTGSVEIRVQDGDTLSDIARTLVDADVVASTGPFVDSAKAHPDATGIQPGVYAMRQKMSGQAALDLLLAEGTRLVSRVTLPEGLTAEATLQRLAEATGTPLEELTAAAQNAAALGLPPYANGSVEGFLFPATYDFEPDTSPTDMLRAMVTRSVQALDELQVPAEQRRNLLTEASLVQAEASSPEDMAKVATVLNNRIADGMPLQLDSTVNYANGKGGVTTTAQDRANPSPYNTYVHPGLPPGPIGNPGEDALRAVLQPTPGDWLFFVTVNPDTGETRFARTAEEHQQNVLVFQQWLRDNPGE